MKKLFFTAVAIFIATLSGYAQLTKAQIDSIILAAVPKEYHSQLFRETGTQDNLQNRSRRKYEPSGGIQSQPACKTGRQLGTIRQSEPTLVIMGNRIEMELAPV